MSEESVHDAETQASHDSEALPTQDSEAPLSHDSEAQPSHDSEATGKTVAKELEQTDETNEAAKESGETTLEDIDIAINGESDDAPREDSSHLMKDLKSALSNSESTQLLIQKEDAKTPDDETESDVKEDVENGRTSEVKPPEGGKDQNEDSSDDTEESDFVDAQAINGIEMLPSSDIHDSDASVKIDSSSEKEPENQDGDETTLLCNDALKHCFVDNTESSNEENSEDPELQFATDRAGSQDDLLSSPPDTGADSSSYETPTSSEVSLSTTSKNQSKVVTIQPTVNGVSCRNSVTDGAPIPPARKNKKKGLSTASLGGCLPMACAGNTSPALTLSRNNSVYGGSVRSRLVAHCVDHCRVGGAVASWLVRMSPNRAVWVRALAGDIALLISWPRHIPSRGEWKYSTWLVCRLSFYFCKGLIRLSYSLNSSFRFEIAKRSVKRSLNYACQLYR